MFALHDISRRRFTISLFLLFGLFPTLTTVAWGWWLNQPAHRENIRLAISELLGAELRVAEVCYPLPGVTVFTQVEWADPETGQTLGKAERLQVVRTGERWNVSATRPEIMLDDSGQLHAWLERLLRTPLGQQLPHLTWDAAEVTLHSGKVSQSFTGVQGWFVPTNQGNQLTAKFHLAGSPHTIASELAISRLRTAKPPATQLTLRTGPTPLPCILLSRHGELADLLGPRSTFAGEVQWVEQGHGWRGELSGRLKDINLYRLMHHRFPHTLSGIGEATVAYAKWSEGRLEEAEGRLDAGPGTVSGSLLQSLAHALQMRLPSTPHMEQLLPYDELSVAFQMQGPELALRGTCGGAGPAVFRIDAATMLDEPTRPQDVAGLIRALVPASETLVPASQESHWLLAGLPLPRSAPLTPASPPAPHPLPHNSVLALDPDAPPRR